MTKIPVCTDDYLLNLEEDLMRAEVKLASAKAARDAVRKKMIDHATSQALGRCKLNKVSIVERRNGSSTVDWRGLARYIGINQSLISQFTRRTGGTGRVWQVIKNKGAIYE